jgi:hypothetical protein
VSENSGETLRLGPDGQNLDDVDKTGFFDSRNLEKAKASLPIPLYCYRNNRGRWMLTEYTPEKKSIYIGSELKMPGFKISDLDASELQVIIQRAGGQWRALEQGRTSMMIVNGIKKRQSCLLPGVSDFVEIGQTQMVLSTVNPKDKEELDCPPTELLKITAPDAEAKFKYGQTIIFGSGECCNFKTDGDEVAAVISSFKNVLYIYPVSDSVAINNQKVNFPVILKADSAIRINGKDISMEYPAKYQGAPQFDSLPEAVEMNMALLEIRQDGSAGGEIPLPDAGASIHVGRKLDYGIIIDSSMISKKHAQLIIYDTSIMLMDCYSTNGTFVNGESTSKRRIYPGDMIAFADRQFLLCFTNE